MLWVEDAQYCRCRLLHKDIPVPAARLRSGADGKPALLTLMVGIVCGAYTSVCITGALWYVMKHVGKNKYVPSKAVQNKTKNK